MNEKLYEVLGDMNENYVKEAREDHKAKKPVWLKWGAMAACFVVIVVTAVSVLPNYLNQQGTTPPDNSNGVIADNPNDDNIAETQKENEIVFKKSDYMVSSSLDMAVTIQPLSEEDTAALFPNLDITAHAVYNDKDGTGEGELLGFEGKIGNVKIIICTSDVNIIDTEIIADEATFELNGTPISARYFVTKPNSKGEQNAIYYATFEIGKCKIYLENGGTKDNSETTKNQLTEVIQKLIENGDLDLTSFSDEIVKDNEAPVVTDNIVDYSEYFQEISGCAVIYDESSNIYSLYNKEKCETEVSPLSTFKIVSALAGLENNVLENQTSTMEYSGVKYPIDTWNSNLTLKEAFETSCVWYFRQVIDMVGQEDIRAMLKEIQYGNCDISEWNGSETNSLPELNGFWLESSLEISPKQQVVTLNYIFGSENNFNADNLEELKSIMYIAELDKGCLYGKTGSGTDGKAWFVGFIEENDNKIYFAIYLDDMQNKEVVSGNKAKEIAISILNNEV